MRLKRTLIFTVLLAGLGYLIYTALPPSSDGLAAVEKLATVDEFSLGHVGLRGPIPKREDWFITILRSRHADRLFSLLYRRGTPAARSYALAGLRLTDMSTYRRCAADYSATTVTLRTAGGCYVHEGVSPVSIVQAFDSGAVEDYMKDRDRLYMNWPHE